MSHFCFSFSSGFLPCLLMPPSKTLPLHRALVCDATLSLNKFVNSNQTAEDIAELADSLLTSATAYLAGKLTEGILKDKLPKSIEDKIKQEINSITSDLANAAVSVAKTGIDKMKKSDSDITKNWTRIEGYGRGPTFAEAMKKGVQKTNEKYGIK